jgi:hypothetical protein
VLTSCVNLLGYSLYFLPSYVFGTLVTETLFFYFLSGVQLSFMTYAAMFAVSLAITVAFCLVKGVNGLNGYLYAPFALQIWYVQRLFAFYQNDAIFSLPNLDVPLYVIHQDIWYTGARTSTCGEGNRQQHVFSNP